MIAAVLGTAFLLLAAPTPATVYYGKFDGAKKPGQIVATKVFQEIPEYMKIRDRGLKEDDPEYSILLAKANAKFYAAVAVAAVQASCDVVVEKGSAVFTAEVVDLTQKAIGAIEK